MINRLSKEEFINKSITIHGDKYDYSLVNYINYATNANKNKNKLIKNWISESIISNYIKNITICLENPQ
jgi:hypothetical protein